MAQAPIARGDVYFVKLDPVQGREMRKTRPCVVVSPDELNQHLNTTIVAPMTTRGRIHPWRVRCRFRNRDGAIALDQIRTVDMHRLGKKQGVLPTDVLQRALSTLQEMFAP